MKHATVFRMYAFFVLLFAAMVTIAVIGGHGGTSSTGGLVPPDLAVDRIAYVGLDGQIRTVNPDGSDTVTIGQGEGFQTWPTWSPDGRRVVFSSIDQRSDASLRVSLREFNSVNGSIRELHVRPEGVVGLVARDAPHYPYWSPDGRRLAFIGNTEDGLSLFVDDVRGSTGPVRAFDGGPLWMDWSPDSETLLVHQGDGHFLLEPDLGRTEALSIRSEGSGYLVPNWRPYTDSITYVAERPDAGFALYTSDVDTMGEMEFDVVPQRAAFLWSPDGETLAVTRTDPNIVFAGNDVHTVYRQVGFYSADGTRLPIDVNDGVLAFFWAPDSTKLAYVTLSRPNGVMSWKVLDVTDGSSWPLIEFLPSTDQLTMFEFFSQYARSHSIWSPDSRSIVFAGSIVGNAITASIQGQGTIDRVIVLSTARSPWFEVIADGFLAFWSPR